MKKKQIICFWIMLRASKERNAGWRNRTQMKGGCPGNEDVCRGTDGVIREQVSRDRTQAAACVSWRRCSSRRCSSRVRACLRPQVLPRRRLLSRSGVGAQATCVDGLAHCALFEDPPLQSELGVNIRAISTCAHSGAGSQRPHLLPFPFLLPGQGV